MFHDEDLPTMLLQGKGASSSRRAWESPVVSLRTGAAVNVVGQVRSGTLP